MRRTAGSRAAGAPGSCLSMHPRFACRYEDRTLVSPAGWTGPPITLVACANNTGRSPRWNKPIGLLSVPGTRTPASQTARARCAALLPARLGCCRADPRWSVQVRAQGVVHGRQPGVRAARRVGRGVRKVCVRDGARPCCQAASHEQRQGAWAEGCAAVELAHDGQGWAWGPAAGAPCTLPTR